MPRPSEPRPNKPIETAPDQSLKINEIFFSIQGESSWAGWPTVFVRTSGCNLRCQYCDTTYAYYRGEVQSLAQVVDSVRAHPARHVCITGGEPLLQKDVYHLMRILCDLSYHVSIETSGSIDCGAVDPRVKKIIDVKTPDSGEGQSFVESNLRFADVNSEFKFVICSEKDFDWSIDFAKRNALFERTNVFMSPAFQRVSEQWLAEKILSSGASARLQLQLHKYIWSPHARGV